MLGVPSMKVGPWTQTNFMPITCTMLEYFDASLGKSRMRNVARKVK